MTASSPWTAERVLALAPDAASAQAGRGQTAPSRWPTLGQHDGLLWGECRGSGSKPYQTKVNLADEATSCSCPSRKFPCKHALGLLLLWADRPDLVAESSPPPWVAAWVEARAKRAEVKSRPAGPATAAPADVPADPAGKRKREAARLAKVVAGLDDLDLWLGDLVRAGFATLASRPANLWDEQARRLVDAQCPGVARRLRQLAGIGRTGEGWQAALLDRLAQLHLLIVGFRRRDALPPPVLADLRAAIGFPADLDAVRSGIGGEHVRDTWEALGHAFALDDKVTVRRTWLRGRAAGRPALILDFAAPGRTFEVGFEPGTAADATLGFFAGAAPLRALLIERHAAAETLVEPAGGQSVSDAQVAFGATLARSPWVELVPVVLAGVRLRRDDEGWAAADGSGAYVLFPRAFDRGWDLEALAGGGPIGLAGEFDGSTFRPLGGWAEGKFINLAATAEEAPVGSPGRWLVPESGLFREATAAAVVGVERKPPPVVPPGHPAAPLLARAADRPAPERLLAVAAASGLAARVGRVPRLGPALPLAIPFPPEDRPECSTAAARRLHALLAEATEPARALTHEWVLACDVAGQRLSADLLVGVLERYRQEVEPPAWAPAVLGNRGRWLAGQNPRWSILAPPPGDGATIVAWETGTRAARLELLARLRAVDPSRARRLVESTWASEPAALRAAILPLLDRNLGMEDEPFLEAALDDRARDVRLAAAGRLRRLAGSRLAGRMAERARAILRWDGDHLIAIGPGSPDPALVRDGIGDRVRPSDTSDRSVFRQAANAEDWYAAEILAQVPPEAVAALLGQPPAAILAAVYCSPQADLLRSAFDRSILAYGDRNWGRAFALDWIAHDGIPDVSASSALFARLSAAEVDATIADRLRLSPGSTRAGDLAVHLLAAIGQAGTGQVVGMETGREVLRWVRAAVADDRQEAPAEDARRTSLEEARIAFALARIDPALPFELVDEAVAAAEADGIFAAAGDGRLRLAARLVALLGRWTFRRDLHQEFAP